MVPFTDTVNHKGNSSFERKAVILIWRLLGLRFLLDILIGYVNLRHESDLGYQVRNPQHKEDNQCMQVNKKHREEIRIEKVANSVKC